MNARILEQTFQTILYGGSAGRHTEQATVEQLTKEIRKTETLIYFQRDELKLHHWVGGNKTELPMVEKRLLFLHNLECHVGTLLRMPFPHISRTRKERDMIRRAVSELADDLKSAEDYDSQKHQQQLKNITDLFWEDNEEITKNNEIHPTQFPPELIILYELVTIYNLVDQFYNANTVENPH